MRVTDKASILYYTVIDLILLGAHDGGTGRPDEGGQPASRAAGPWPCAATARGPRLCAPAGELHLVLRPIWGGPRGRRSQPDPDADRRVADVPPLVPADPGPPGVGLSHRLDRHLGLLRGWSLAAATPAIAVAPCRGVHCAAISPPGRVQRPDAPGRPGIGLGGATGPRLRRQEASAPPGYPPGAAFHVGHQADPVQVIWTAGSPEPRGLVNIRLVYLGHANGVMVLYDPPKWGTCDIDACRGVVWRVSESDAVIQVEVNPPDAHAPSISDPYPS